MMLQLLPTELQLAILQVLPEDDFRKLRLTCRTLGDAGKTILSLSTFKTLKAGWGREVIYLSRNNIMNIIRCCRKIHTLGDCFLPEISSQLTVLNLHDHSGYLTTYRNPRRVQPSTADYEMLDYSLSRVHLPALQHLQLKALTSDKIQVLIRLIDNHAKTLQTLGIWNHKLRERTCCMELFRSGVGLRYEWKPLFESILSIIDRVLHLQSLTLSNLGVELPYASASPWSYDRTANVVFQRRFRVTSTPFHMYGGSASVMTMVTTENEELGVQERGKRPKHIDIEGRYAIRQGLQMLVTGDETYLQGGAGPHS